MALSDTDMVLRPRSKLEVGVRKSISATSQSEGELSDHGCQLYILTKIVYNIK